MLPQVHHKLLEHLRQSSDGKPQVQVPASEALPPELLTWRRSLDSFLPVLGALSRSMLVRNTCAIGLGSLLLTAGGAGGLYNRGFLSRLGVFNISIQLTPAYPKKASEPLCTNHRRLNREPRQTSTAYVVAQQIRTCLTGKCY